jgi:hypothetical protein
LAKKLKKSCRKIWMEGSCFFRGRLENYKGEVFLGGFGEEERQEDDSVLVVVFVFADCLASC